MIGTIVGAIAAPLVAKVAEKGVEKIVGSDSDRNNQTTQNTTGTVDSQQLLQLVMALAEKVKNTGLTNTTADTSSLKTIA